METTVDDLMSGLNANQQIIVHKIVEQNTKLAGAESLDCSICLSYLAGIEVRKLDACGHLCHVDCLVKHICKSIRNPKCIICKAPIRKV